MRFHNHVILIAQVILFFEAIIDIELITLIVKGHLDYINLDYNVQNLSALLKG